MILADERRPRARHARVGDQGRYRGGAAGRRDRGDARPGVGARFRAVEVDARGAVRWALVLAGCWALFRLCVWLSWGLWAVTR